ncbi:MAG TPA: fructosamine kinase family protein [Ignavibacteriaceae bacterium]|nr:MAG: Fructosamine kinase [Ignavibacteria bacterium ADurb.Bin266]HQF42549.1 fructosamine kinase family protein [Ignavibacteriaceae bacterium]HQI40192.1 fructosamine kinase family protein [Ignavibacteriaceae bacterium]HQJ47222.1 fructosamine kinase family protein [Ignavibacteriaceae bacterium]
MKREIINKIEDFLSEKINHIKPVGGGCINDARIITTEKENKYFLKFNLSSKRDMFPKEANGLIELKKSGAIRIPDVISVDNNYLLLEMIEHSNKAKTFWEDFGRGFAKLHKYLSSSYGFFEDNYIGSTLQLNIPNDKEKNDWCEYYFNKRLLFQYRLAEKNGYTDSSLNSAFIKLEKKICKILGNDLGIPSLLHGDLWSGNFITDETGNACLIDPAVYYGNREADLAMTKLFGGFDPVFYYSYNEIFPFDDGYHYRENIYKLYHVLNHLNLFGSGYYRQALNLMMYYI